MNYAKDNTKSGDTGQTKPITYDPGKFILVKFLSVQHILNSGKGALRIII